jgi:hypothetical protein
MPDIIGEQRGLSRSVWLRPVTPLGREIFREAALELYGDAGTESIYYEYRQCEGAYVIARMACRGAVVQMPDYVLDGTVDGERALAELG